MDCRFEESLGTRHHLCTFFLFRDKRGVGLNYYSRRKWVLTKPFIHYHLLLRINGVPRHVEMGRSVRDRSIDRHAPFRGKVQPYLKWVAGLPVSYHVSVVARQDPEPECAPPSDKPSKPRWWRQNQAASFSIFTSRSTPRPPHYCCTRVRGKSSQIVLCFKTPRQKEEQASYLEHNGRFPPNLLDILHNRRRLAFEQKHFKHVPFSGFRFPLTQTKSRCASRYACACLSSTTKPLHKRLVNIILYRQKNSLLCPRDMLFREKGVGGLSSCSSSWPPAGTSAAPRTRTGRR